jgi:tetratricopeptide (TPR) repeat protein
MPTLFEFSQQISKYKKENKCSEALAYFKENKGNFTKEQIRSNEYIISDILSCLRHLNKLDAGFQFLSIYGIKINDQQKERILIAYGWLLWAKYKADNEKNGFLATEDDYIDGDDEQKEKVNFDYEKSELLEKIETLISILNSFKSDYTKNLLSNLFHVVLKSEKNKPAPNWKLLNEFCDKIDREKLSKECSTIQVERKGKLKDMELASDFENWYAYKTKALEKLGRWQECLNLSKEALEKIEKFHYSNDVWFSRRIALSKRNLGNIEDAIQELQTILKKKREWFIQKELAELYFEKGDLELALKHAIDAINNFGQLEFKVDLLYLLGKILKQQKKLELSFQHFSLSKLIRQKEGWKLPQKLLDELKTFSFPEIPQTDLNKLINELHKYWDNFKAPQTEKNKTFEGKIVRILHDNERGKDGFIKCDEKEFYFSVNPNFKSISKIVVGAKVLFEVKPPLNNQNERSKIIKVIE